MKKFKEILFLQNIKGIGKSAIYKKYWHLLQSCGNVQDLADGILSMNDHLSEAGLDKAVRKAESDLATLQKMPDVWAVTVFDGAYPSKLNVMKEKRPLILYGKGNTELLDQPSVAVIGTRKPSIWTQKVEQNLVKKVIELSDRVIISGLALGCDRIAHETAVRKGGETLAVLPSGVNVITPASHKKLAEDIIRTGGCIVSEYVPNAKAFKTTYIERDAVVAALSDKIFAMECGVKSGTMHTMDYAAGYGRTIGCYQPTDLAKGNYSGNLFMQQQKGAIGVTNTAELTKFLYETTTETKEMV